MELEELIQHPEELNRETLYDLRSLLALYPYYQTARILLLQNLYILHDPDFDEELRRAAIYISDRKVIFKMVEAAHYQLRKNVAKANEEAAAKSGKGDRTTKLIDSFLDSIPQDETTEEKQKRRKPTPADAAVDYVAYLLECETDTPADADDSGDRTTQLIDNFIEDGGFKLHLDDDEDEPEAEQAAEETEELVFDAPQSMEYKIEDTAEEEEEDVVEETQEPEEEEEEETKDEPAPDGTAFTETLARIYIKQGKYGKALEIIQRLNLNNPKKSAYFADQMRFLEKLIINNKNNK